MRPPTLKSLWSVFGAIAVALTLAIPGTAWSQEDEVHVDPNSPAGVEYELPLDRARQEAGGGGGGGNTGSGGGSAGGATATGETPLFGEGVVSDGSAPARDGGASRSAGESTGSDGRPAPTPPTVRAQAPSPDDGGGALLAVVGGAGGVLALGALAGLLWRRRSPVEG